MVATQAGDSDVPDFQEIDFNEITELARNAIAKKEEAGKEQWQRLPHELFGMVKKFSLTAYINEHLVDLVKEYLAKH